MVEILLRLTQINSIIKWSHAESNDRWRFFIECESFFARVGLEAWLNTVLPFVRIYDITSSSLCKNDEQLIIVTDNEDAARFKASWGNYRSG